MMERSQSGAWRLPLGGGRAIAFSTFPWWSPVYLALYPSYHPRAWSLRVLFFHVGWAPRDKWSHWEKNE